MAPLKLRYVQRLTDRHGHMRYYFRKPGHERVTLPPPGTPLTAEFLTGYQAALAGETAPQRQIGSDRTLAGTFNALAALYYQSADFTTLAESTRADSDHHAS